MSSPSSAIYPLVIPKIRTDMKLAVNTALDWLKVDARLLARAFSTLLPCTTTTTTTTNLPQQRWFLFKSTYYPVDFTDYIIFRALSMKKHLVYIQTQSVFQLLCQCSCSEFFISKSTFCKYSPIAGLSNVLSASTIFDTLSQHGRLQSAMFLDYVDILAEFYSPHDICPEELYILRSPHCIDYSHSKTLGTPGSLLLTDQNIYFTPQLSALKPVRISLSEITHVKSTSVDSSKNVPGLTIIVNSKSASSLQLTKKSQNIIHNINMTSNSSSTSPRSYHQRRSLSPISNSSDTSTHSEPPSDLDQSFSSSESDEFIAYTWTIRPNQDTYATCDLFLSFLQEILSSYKVPIENPLGQFCAITGYKHNVISTTSSLLISSAIHNLIRGKALHQLCHVLPRPLFYFTHPELVPLLSQDSQHPYSLVRFCVTKQYPLNFSDAISKQDPLIITAALKEKHDVNSISSVSTPPTGSVLKSMFEDTANVFSAISAPQSTLPSAVTNPGVLESSEEQEASSSSTSAPMPTTTASAVNPQSFERKSSFFRRKPSVVPTIEESDIASFNFVDNSLSDLVVEESAASASRTPSHQKTNSNELSHINNLSQGTENIENTEISTNLENKSSKRNILDPIGEAQLESIKLDAKAVHEHTTVKVNATQLKIFSVLSSIAQQLAILSSFAHPMIRALISLNSAFHWESLSSSFLVLFLLSWALYYDWFNYSLQIFLIFLFSLVLAFRILFLLDAEATSSLLHQSTQSTVIPPQQLVLAFLNWINGVLVFSNGLLDKFYYILQWKDIQLSRSFVILSASVSIFSFYISFRTVFGALLLYLIIRPIFIPLVSFPLDHVVRMSKLWSEIRPMNKIKSSKR